MISTISERATSSSRNESGIRPAMARLRSTAQLGFDLRAHRGHVGPALSLGFDDAHDLAHVLDAGGARGCDRIGDQGVDLGIAQLRWHVALKQGNFAGFLVDEIGAITRLELHQRLFALFNHFLENAQDLRVIEGDALIDLALFDRGGQHAYDAETLLLAGAHRRLHIFGNSLLERHGGTISTNGPEQRPAHWPEHRLPCRACSRGTGASNGVLRQRPSFAYALASVSRRI